MTEPEPEPDTVEPVDAALARDIKIMWDDRYWTPAIPFRPRP